MPQIDKLAEKMAQRGIERVVLINDQPMRLFAAGQERTGPAMPMPQLQEIVKEVAPAHLLPQITNDGQFQFPYQSPTGLLNVQVERVDGCFQVALTPLSQSNVAPQHLAPPTLTPQTPKNLADPTPKQKAQLRVNLPPSKRKKGKTLVWIGGIIGVVVLCAVLNPVKDEMLKQRDINYADSQLESQRELLNEAQRLETLPSSSPAQSRQNLVSAIDKQQQAVDVLEKVPAQTNNCGEAFGKALYVEGRKLDTWKTQLSMYDDVMSGVVRR